MKAAEKQRRIEAADRRLSARHEQLAKLNQRVAALRAEQKADDEQRTWLQAAPVHDDGPPAAEATP